MKLATANLFFGYISVLKYIFTRKGDKKFLKLNFSLPAVLITLVIIGFSRLILEVAFGIRLMGNGSIFTGWFSMNPDVIFTMLVFPMYLCFFGAAALCFFLSLVNKKKYNQEILSFCFYLQGLHLFIPFLDILNLKFNIPWYFPFLPTEASKIYLNPIIVMTLGIIIIWILSAIGITRLLKELYKLSIIKIILIEIVVFNLFFWPIYIIFPIFDHFFNSIFQIKETLLYLGPFYGNGFFFLISAILGIFYFRRLFFKDI